MRYRQYASRLHVEQWVARPYPGKRLQSRVAQKVLKANQRLIGVQGNATMKFIGERRSDCRADERGTLGTLQDRAAPGGAPELPVVGEWRRTRRCAGDWTGRDGGEALIPATAVGGFYVGGAGPGWGQRNLIAAPQPLAAVEPSQVGEL